MPRPDYLAVLVDDEQTALRRQHQLAAAFAALVRGVGTGVPYGVTALVDDQVAVALESQGSAFVLRVGCPFSNAVLVEHQVAVVLPQQHPVAGFQNLDFRAFVGLKVEVLRDYRVGGETLIFYKTIGRVIGSAVFGLFPRNREHKSRIEINPVGIELRKRGILPPDTRRIKNRQGNNNHCPWMVPLRYHNNRFWNIQRSGPGGRIAFRRRPVYPAGKAAPGGKGLLPQV